MANTIVRKGYLNIRDQKVATAVAITPGMLVQRTSTDLVEAHSIAGGPVNPLFALEDAFQGNGIDDNYAVSVPIMLWKPCSGEQVYAILDSLSTASVAIGDFVESVGDGKVRSVGDAQSSAGIAEFAHSFIGVAVEAQATPGGRVTIEIL